MRFQTVTKNTSIVNVTKMVFIHIILSNGNVFTYRDLDELGIEDGDNVTAISDENARLHRWLATLVGIKTNVVNEQPNLVLSMIGVLISMSVPQIK